MPAFLHAYRVPSYCAAVDRAPTGRTSRHDTARPFLLRDVDAAATPCFDVREASNGKRRGKQYEKAIQSAKAMRDDEGSARLVEIGNKLDAIQRRLFSQKRQRVLLILQGMDTSGKDSTIRAVFHDVNPAGVDVTSFSAPTPEEAAHDFLWRVHRHAPAGGRIAVFNRSHYEDVLVPRVMGTLDAEGAARRFEQIRQFEALLIDNDTTILKCFLHISNEAQRQRLQERIDNPEKNWKFDASDLKARDQWHAYQAAYEAALAATSTDDAPWYLVPADSKPHRKLMVAELLLHTLERMDVSFPPPRTDLSGIEVI